MFFYKFPLKFNCINHSGKNWKITMGIQRNKNVLYLKPIMLRHQIPLLAIEKPIMETIRIFHS